MPQILKYTYIKNLLSPTPSVILLSNKTQFLLRRKGPPASTHRILESTLFRHALRHQQNQNRFTRPPITLPHPSTIIDMNDVSAAFADSDLCTVFAGLVSDCGDEQRLAKLRLDALELKKWICVQTAPLQLELRRVHREMAELENALKTARNVATDTPASTQGGSHPTDEAENASLQSAATSSEAFVSLSVQCRGHEIWS